MSIFDTTPAFEIATHAYTVDGVDYGHSTTVVTVGQIEGHRLHLEPDNRAAERIAQGRHETTANAGLSYTERAARMPTIVVLTSIVDLAAAKS